MQKLIENIKQKTLNILHWSEQYTKTDMVYIAKGGFWLTVGQFFAIFLVFVLSIAMANLVPKEVYGNYKFILSATAILGSLSLSGINNAVTQAIAQKKEGTFFEAIRINLRWGMVIVGASVLVSTYYWLNNNSSLSIAMIIVGISTAITSAYGLYGSLLSGNKDFKTSTLWWSISSTISTVSLIITVVFIQNVIAMISVYFASSVLTTLFFYKCAVDKFNPDSSHETDYKLLNYGKHMSLINFLSGIANQLDKILVFHYLGAAELAIYSFAIAIPEQIKGSYKNLFNIALPKYSETSPERIRDSIKDKIIKLTAITAFIVFAYILLSPFIFELLFPKYLDSIFYSQIYMLGLIAIPGISLFGTYFQVNKNTAVFYKVGLIGNISTIILTFLLIQNYGILGAVIENGLSWFILLAANAYYFQKDIARAI